MDGPVSKMSANHRDFESEIAALQTLSIHDLLSMRIYGE